MSQKIHGYGTEARYFYNVSIKAEGTGQYRSRHATTAGVRKEFIKNGKVLTSCKAVMHTNAVTA